MSDDLVKRLRQPWDTDRSIMSQTGRWMTEREDAADRIEELEAENRHLRIMLDSYGRLSTDKARLTKLREYIQTKTRAKQVKGQADAD